MVNYKIRCDRCHTCKLPPKHFFGSVKFICDDCKTPKVI